MTSSTAARSNGVLDGLNHLIDLAIPEFNSMGGTRIIPGHGRISNEIDLVEYRDAMTIIADRITQLVLDGKTVEQVKAAGVSLDYDGVYGATTGPWTTDMFLEAAYREIKANTRGLEGAPVAQRAGRRDPADSWQERGASGCRKSAPAARAGKKGSGDPLEGKWVLNLFASSYEPSSLMPYRRGDGRDRQWGRSRACRSRRGGDRRATAHLCRRTTTRPRLDGKEYPIPNWGQRQGHGEARRWRTRSSGRMAGDQVGSETATWTLSADRKTLTVVAKGTDASGVAYVSTRCTRSSRPETEALSGGDRAQLSSESLHSMG